MTDVAMIAEALRGFRFSCSTEDQLQAAIHEALRSVGYDAVREVRLDSGSRVDVLVGRVAVEAKIAGSHRDVARQVDRYLASPDVDGVVVVTTKVAHLQLGDLDDRVEVVTLARAGL